MKNSVSNSAAVRKSELTRNRILEAALQIFRTRSFERATMREIATEAKVAVGAAYYYFDSKDAIVMAFYERAQQEMGPAITAQLNSCRNLESRLRAVIGYKFSYFAPDRQLLAALSAHTNPQHPLSPFSATTAAIRDADVALFERAVTDSSVKLPRRLSPYLPRLLWLYQMGLILFWVYDRSPRQQRTDVLFEKSLKMLLLLIRIAGLPVLMPLHRMAADLLDTVYETPGTTGEELAE
jgi:AcrR family transcriptional regulator